MTWKTCKTHGESHPSVWACPECLRELREENKRLRYHLTELGKAADAAAMVIATIEAEDTTEEEKLQAVMDAIGTLAPDAIMGPN